MNLYTFLIIKLLSVILSGGRARYHCAPVRSVCMWTCQCVLIFSLFCSTTFQFPAENIPEKDANEKLYGRMNRSFDSCWRWWCGWFFASVNTKSETKQIVLKIERGKNHPKMLLQRIYVWSNFPLGIFKIFLNRNIIIIVMLIINRWGMLSSHFSFNWKPRDTLHTFIAHTDIDTECDRDVEMKDGMYIHSFLLANGKKAAYERSWTWVTIKRLVNSCYSVLSFFPSAVVLTNRAITVQVIWDMGDETRNVFSFVVKSYLSMSRQCPSVLAGLLACMLLCVLVHSPIY